MEKTDYGDVDATLLNDGGGAVLRFSGRPIVCGELSEMARKSVSNN